MHVVLCITGEVSEREFVTMVNPWIEQKKELKEDTERKRNKWKILKSDYIDRQQPTNSLKKREKNEGNVERLD